MGANNWRQRCSSIKNVWCLSDEKVETQNMEAYRFGSSDLRDAYTIVWLCNGKCGESGEITSG